MAKRLFQMSRDEMEKYVLKAREACKGNYCSDLEIMEIANLLAEEDYNNSEN